jgi:hypothetical protein
MVGLIEYGDADLRMMIPSDLVQTHAPLRYFARRKGRWKEPGILTLAVELPANVEVVEATRKQIVDAKLFDEWAGVRNSVIRRGACAHALREAVELLATSTNTVTGEVLHAYNTLFLESGRYVHATFGGRGPVDDFDKLCGTIICSIRLTRIENGEA